ncbi:MAG: ABC transporter permease, partial [Microbacterium sp.]
MSIALSQRSGALTRMVALGTWRARFELRQYARSADTLFFTFLFPVVMLGLFSVAFGAAGDISPAPGLPPLSMAELYLPGMMAAGLLLSGFQ